MKRAPKPPLLIGWRERIALPQLGLSRLTAKIDTGARTSALHATRIREFERDGAAWVRFHIPHSSGLQARDCEAPLLETRAIRNTSGVNQDRMVIETRLEIAGRHWPIEVSLADRANMTHPIILGRTAVRKRGILIDAGRSFMTAPKLQKQG